VVMGVGGAGVAAKPPATEAAKTAPVTANAAMGRRMDYKKQRRQRFVALRAALGGPATEALDAPARVHELLTARVERMAVGADLHMQLRLGRASGEFVAARAADVGL